VRDLIRQQVLAGFSREIIMDKLRASKEDAGKQIPNFELRSLDNLV
jgi:hypothetical protein